MAFVMASDEFRQVDLTLFPKVYEEFKDMILKFSEVFRCFSVVQNPFLSPAFMRRHQYPIQPE